MHRFPCVPKIRWKLGSIKQTCWSRSIQLLINNSRLMFCAYFSFFLSIIPIELHLSLVCQHIDQLMWSKTRENGCEMLSCDLKELTLIMIISHRKLTIWGTNDGQSFVLLSVFLYFIFQETIMGGLIFSTSILECRAMMLRSNPMCAVSIQSQFSPTHYTAIY